MHALVTLPPEIIGSLRLYCTQHTIAYRMHHEETISCVLNVQRQQSPFSKLKHFILAHIKHKNVREKTLKWRFNLFLIGCPLRQTLF